MIHCAMPKPPSPRRLTDGTDVGPPGMALPYDAIAPAASPQPRGMMRMRAVALAFGIAMVACVGLLAVGEPPVNLLSAAPTLP